MLAGEVPRAGGGECDAAPMNEITAKQHRFAYRESAEGRVAFLVHGFPLDSTMWLEQLEALSDVRRCNVRICGISEHRIRPRGACRR